MGRFGYGPGVGGTSPVSSSQGPVAPRYAPPTGRPGPAGFTERGFPERMDTEMLVPDQIGAGMPEFLDKVAFRGPAYVHERPIAAVSELLGWNNPENPGGGSILDPVAEAARNLTGGSGGFGDQLGKGAENLLDTTFKAVGSVGNSVWAGSLEGLREHGMDEDLPLGKALAWEALGVNKDRNGRMTRRIIENWMSRLGWDKQDIRDVQEGRKGWFDFGEKTLAYGGAIANYPDRAAIMDFGTRLVADPTNLLFAPVAVISKTAKGIKALDTVLTGGRVISNTTAAGAAKMFQSANKTANALLGRPALSASLGARGLAAGNAAGVTSRGLSEYLIGATRGGVKYYKRAAIGTTAAQVGINTVDAITPEDSVIRDVLEPLFDTARRMGERKPLSNNDLFALYSVMYFPGRSLAEKGLSKVKGKMDDNRMFSHTEAVLKEMYPDMGYAQARAAAVARMGSEDSFRAFMWQVLRTALHEKNFLEGIGGFPQLHRAENAAEIGFLVREMQQTNQRDIVRALKSGTLAGKDAVRALHRFVEGRGGLLEDLSGGVAMQRFDSELVYRSWEAWEPIARKLSDAMPNGSPFVPGIADDVVLEEGIDWLVKRIDSAAVDGTVTGAQLEELASTMPAIFRYPSSNMDLSRALVREAGDTKFQVSELKNALREIRDEHAVSQSEYFAQVTEWERMGERAEIRTRRGNQILSEGGQLADDVHPNLGNAEVVVMTRARTTNRQAGGMGPHVDNVRALRGQTETAIVEHSIPNGLNTAGFDIKSAVQVGMLERTPTVQGRAGVYSNTGLAIRVNEARPMQDLEHIAAISLERTEAPRASIILRGADLVRAKGLTPNAVEHTWTVGKLSEDGWNELATLFQRFGDRVVINDTTGVVRVIETTGSQTANREFQRAMRAAQKKYGQSTQDIVYVKDILNRKRVPNNAAGAVTLRDVIADAESTRRYHAAKSYIREFEPGGLALPERSASRSELARRALAASGGASTDRAASGSRPTRWERRSQRGVRGRTEEHAVDLATPEARSRWEDRIAEAGITEPGGRRFVLRDGDRLHVAGDAASGAIVRADGELIVWTRRSPTGRNLRAADDFGDTISEASEHATWTRILDTRDRHGLSAVDRLADHGWVPIGKNRGAGEHDIVWLVRDPDEALGFRLPPAFTNGHGGWASMSDDVMTYRTPQMGRAQAEALADALNPERTARARQAAKDSQLLNRLRRIDEIDVEMQAIEARVANPRQSSTYRTLEAERERLRATTSTTAAQARREALTERQIAPGNVTFVKGLDADLGRFVPNLDESIAGDMRMLAPEEARKVMDIEADLRRAGGWWDTDGVFHNGTDYTLKFVPRGGTPYYIGQNDAYTAVMQGREAISTGLRDKVTSRFAQLNDMMFGRVYSKEMARDSRQEVYNLLLNKGANATEANQFLAALRHAWENQDYQFLGARPIRSVDALTPGKINAIARGQVVIGKKGKPLFQGFSEDVINQVGDFADLIQMSSSRTFRNLQRKFPAKDGEGNLGRLIEQWYGKQSGGVAGVGKAARRTVYYGAFGYHMLRFMFDPRWYAMNLMEADILAGARYGLKSVKDQPRGSSYRDFMRGKGQLVDQDPAINRLAGRQGDSTFLSVEEVLRADQGAAGWMDPRNLYGYVRNASRLQRPQTTRKVLQEAIEGGSPVIDDLRALFGDNPEKWIDELEETLFRVDTRGARQAVLDDPLARQMLEHVGPESQVYREFLEGLFQAHQKNYQDIVHTFHGNVNRSNMERLINSPLLWWPMSYQLKVGKWVIDLMTKQVGGIAGKEMMGSGALGKLMANWAWSYENNEDFAKVFDDHPALWRTLGMLLPMTPFDMGAFMARWTRYSGSWVGAQLGLWEQDPSYPQDPYNFMIRSLSIGPAFSVDILKDILDEFRDKDS